MGEKDDKEHGLLIEKWTRGRDPSFIDWMERYLDAADGRGDEDASWAQRYLGTDQAGGLTPAQQRRRVVAHREALAKLILHFEDRDLVAAIRRALGRVRPRPLPAVPAGDRLLPDGGHGCRHLHQAAASRCLPHFPRSIAGSGLRAFSLPSFSPLCFRHGNVMTVTVAIGRLTEALSTRRRLPCVRLSGSNVNGVGWEPGPVCLARPRWQACGSVLSRSPNRSSRRTAERTGS